MDDFYLAPDYVFDETPQYNTAISQFENGVEQRRQKWASSLTKYRLVYKNRDSTDKDTILTLFNAKKGALTSFTWTHPISAATKTVRFVEDSLTIENTVYGFYNIEFTLQEVK